MEIARVDIRNKNGCKEQAVKTYIYFFRLHYDPRHDTEMRLHDITYNPGIFITSYNARLSMLSSRSAGLGAVARGESLE